MAKKEYYSFVTPLGRARFPKLDRQDVYEGKEVGYKLGIIFEGAELKKIEAEVEKAIKQLTGGAGIKKGKKTPLREDNDDNTYFEAKSYKKVPLFAAKGNTKLPEDTKVGGGSLLRAKVSLGIGNGHLVAYMNSVQIAELKQGGGGDGFDDLEGYESPETDDSGFDDVEGDDLDI